jgi:membrane protein
VRRILLLFRDTYVSWDKDNAPRLGAALAYYTIFSIPPLLILLIGLAGVLFDSGRVQDRFVGTIEHLVGPHGAAAVQDMLRSAHRERHGVLATTVGLITLVLGASGVFGNLKDALNVIWHVEPKPGRGLILFARKYLFSVLVLLGTGFLLIVSLALNTLLAALGDTLSRYLPGGAALWQAVNVVVSLGTTATLFALMYRYIPDVRVAWKDALLGGIVTSALFTGGEALIGFYLGRTDVGSSFGAAGSLAVVLVWVYYSAMIFFFGAEFTKCYATRYGAPIIPEPDAKRVAEAG